MRPQPQRLFKTLIALVLTAALSPTAAATGPSPTWISPLHQDHPLVGQIIKLKSGKTITEAELMNQLAKTDVIILGEKHDNPDHHLIQARVIEKLSSRGRVRPVIFEQVVTSQQAALDRYLSAKPVNCAGLPKVLQWQGNGWPPWSIYRPVFEAACASGGDMIAGSMTRQQTRKVSRQGATALDPGLVNQFKLNQKLSHEHSKTLMTELEAAHCNLMPSKMLEPMQLVQRSRDAYMAAAVVRLIPPRAFVITGNGHGVTDFGVPALVKQAGQASVISIALLEVQPGKSAPNHYLEGWFRHQLPFDYVWFTPRANDKDHCAELKKRFSGHSHH